MKSKIKELNDKTFLYDKYIEEKLSCHKIANLIGCDSSTVYKHLKQFDITIRNYTDAGIYANGDNYKFLGSKEWLCDKYINKKMSSEEIAELLSCCSVTIDRALKKLGIEKISKISESIYSMLNNKELLIQKYIEEKLSCKKIAKLIGCNKGTVINALERNGIKRRSNMEVSIINRNKSFDYSKLDDKKWLTKKYWNDKFSPKDISEIIGCSDNIVVYYMRKYSIKMRTRKESSKLENRNKRLSNSSMGEKSSKWKGGISTISFKDKYGIEIIEWKKIAQEVRKRDKFICQYCGNYPSVEVHHLIPARIKIDNSQDNLITLCKSCNMKIEYLTNECLEKNKDPIEIFYDKWSS